MTLSLRHILPYGLAALLLIFSAPSAEAQDLSEREANALLDRLQTRYASAEAIRAEITQTTHSAFSDASQTFSGALLLSGAKYRIETPQQTVVTDGETVWIYNPSQDQVLINQYIQDDGALAPRDLFTGYRERFSIKEARTELESGQAFAVLRLVPTRNPSPLREVTLWLRRPNSLPVRVRTIDANGTETTFRLDGLDFDPSLPAEPFRFEPPAGAEVIDLRDGET